MGAILTTVAVLLTGAGAHVKELGLEVSLVPGPPGQEEGAAVGPRQPTHVQQDLGDHSHRMSSLGKGNGVRQSRPQK